MAEKISSSQEWLLSKSETAHFNQLKERSAQEGKPMVLWGWKRDRVVGGQRQPESRTVYFSADLEEQHGQIDITRAFFVLETRATGVDITALYAQIANKKEVDVWEDTNHPVYWRLRMSVGDPTDYDIKTVNRRLKGKPKITISPPKLVPESYDYDISRLAPFALVAGSGLSSESGLPLLGTIHNLFEVDNFAGGELIFGAADNLPRRVSQNPEHEFREFCQFTIDAIRAQPSESHRLIADLYNKGIIRQVFTDNMDDILDKVNVPYIRTRQGIFPDKYPAEFEPKVRSLLVVGIAVDRRQVIRQARAAGLRIIVVNPILGVAPHSRNMDYMRRGDIFFKLKACEALPEITSASRF